MFIDFTGISREFEESSHIISRSLVLSFFVPYPGSSTLRGTARLFYTLPLKAVKIEIRPNSAFATICDWPTSDVFYGYRIELDLVPVTQNNTECSCFSLWSTLVTGMSLSQSQQVIFTLDASCMDRVATFNTGIFSLGSHQTKHCRESSIGWRSPGRERFGESGVF